MLLLVRHGIAEESHPDGDLARRLTAAGRAVFERHAQDLALRVHITRVVASPATRARDSAEILAQALGVRAVELRPDLAWPAVDAATILAAVKQLGPGVAIVSHNPALADAVTRLIGRQARVGFSPGTAVALSPDSSSTGWVLRFTHHPPSL